MDDAVPGPRRWRADAGGEERGDLADAGSPRSGGEARLRRLAAAALVGLTVWGFASIGPRGRVIPGHEDQHMTDFTVFTAAGSAFFDGRDPYRVTNPRGWYYLYPPLFALLVAPLSALEAEWQVLAWHFLNVGLAFGCFGEARRLYRMAAPRCSPRLARGIRVGAGLAVFLPFLDCMQAGQLGIAILYLLLVGARLVLEGRSWRRWALGGLILALPAVVKLVPALPVVFLLAQRWAGAASSRGEPRRWGRALAPTAGFVAGVFLFLLAIPAALIGWQKNLDHLRVWHARVVANDRVGPNANFNVHSFRNQSLANAVYLWMKSIDGATTTDAPDAERPDRPERMVHPRVRFVIGGILALLLAIAVTSGRSPDPLDRATGFGLACCATLLVSPLAWGHYYMTPLPAVLCAPAWLASRGRPRMAAFAAAVPPVLSWSYYLAMPYTGGLGLLGLGTTAWFLGISGALLGVEIATVLTGSGPRQAAAREARPAHATPHATGKPRALSAPSDE